MHFISEDQVQLTERFLCQVDSMALFRIPPVMYSLNICIRGKVLFFHFDIRFQSFCLH